MYYQFAQQELIDRKYDSEFERLSELITSKELIRKFQFLEHPKLVSFLEGRSYFDLDFQESSKTIYEPSPNIESLFESKIITLVKEHLDTIWPSTLLGYTSNIIRPDVLKYGKANFDDSYQGLTPDEIVLLYCYFNMRKHFFTSYSIFERIENLDKYFSNDESLKPIFIDLGCGPATSLIALADFISNKTKQSVSLSYIGIDISESMIRKAKDFVLGIDINSESQISFFKSWDESYGAIAKLKDKTNLIIINASYLFASESLNVDNLVNFINKLFEKNIGIPIFFIYQNPIDENKNIKFLELKQKVDKLRMVKAISDKVLYHTKANSFYEPSSEIVRFELLSNI